MGRAWAQDTWIPLCMGQVITNQPLKRIKLKIINDNYTILGCMVPDFHWSRSILILNRTQYELYSLVHSSNHRECVATWFTRPQISAFTPKIMSSWRHWPSLCRFTALPTFETYSTIQNLISCTRYTQSWFPRLVWTVHSDATRGIIYYNKL